MISLKNKKLLENNKFKLVRNNPFIMKVLISKDSSNISYALNNALTESNIEAAFEAGFVLDESSPEILRNNPKVIKISVEKNYGSIEYALPGGLTEENIRIAIENGYTLTGHSPVLLKSNPQIVMASIKKRIRSIDYALENALTDEVIKIAIERGYVLHEYSSDFLRNNESIVISSIQANPQNIDYVSENMLTEANIKRALELGYVLKIESPELLKNNKEVVESSIKKNPNIIDYLPKSSLTDNNIKLALEMGYILHEKSSDFLKNNLDVAQKSLESDPQNLDFVSQNIITEELIDLAFKKGYRLTMRCPRQLIESNLLKKYIRENRIDLNNQYLIEMFEKYGSYVYAGIQAGVLKDEVMNVFGKNGQMKIFKYLFLSGKISDMNQFIKNEELPMLCYLYSYLSKDNSFENNFDIILFENILKKYNKYRDLAITTIRSGKKESINNLIKIFSNQYIEQYSIDINSNDELDNIDKKINDSKKDIVNNSNDIEKIKNVILLSLFNQDLYSFKEMLENVIDVGKCDDLLNEISDPQTKESISKIRTILLFSEGLIRCDDIDLLRNIAIQIINNNIQFNGLSSNIKDIAYSFYTQDINENMTNIEAIKAGEDQSISIVEGKYFSSETTIGKNSGEIKLGKQPVKLIQIDREAHFFAHVTNAFGSEGKISEWRNSRLIGATSLCLSAISNDTQSVDIKPSDIDSGITLLFDGLKEGSLVGFNDHDIGSHSKDNDYNIESRDYNMGTLASTLNKTETYNEYLVYRENSDGSFIYPSGVLIQGEEPVQAEIDAAAYLGVPLVKLSKEIKKNRDASVEETKKTEEHLSNRDYIVELQNIIKNLQSMNKQNSEPSNVVDNIEEAKMNR